MATESRTDGEPKTATEERIREWTELVNQGNEHFEKKRTVNAEECYLKALAIAEQLAGIEAGSGGDAWRQAGEADQDRLSKSANNLAALYHSQGKYGLAEENYERSLDIKLSLYGEDHRETAINYHNLAMLYSARRLYPRAEILYKRTLEVREKEYGKAHPELMPVLQNYALMLKKANRLVEAAAVETRYRTIRELHID